MYTLIAEPVDAPNPAIALRFQAGRHWRGVGDPCRSVNFMRTHLLQLVVGLLCLSAFAPTFAADGPSSPKVQSPNDAVEAYCNHRRNTHGSAGFEEARLRAHYELHFDRGFSFVGLPGFSSPDGRTWVVTETNATGKKDVVAWIDGETGKALVVSDALSEVYSGKSYPRWTERLMPPEWWNEKARRIWFWGGPWIVFWIISVCFAAASRSASSTLLNCLVSVGFLLWNSREGGWIQADVGSQKIWWFVLAIPAALLSSYIIAKRKSGLNGILGRLTLPWLFLLCAGIWSYFLFVDALDPLRGELNRITPAWFEFIATYPAWWLQWGEPLAPCSMRPYMAPLQATMIVSLWLVVVRAWQAIPPGKARMTPQWAVGGMLIPLFNIYWLFNVIVGLVTDLHRFLARNDTRLLRSMRTLAIAVVVVWLVIDIPMNWYLGAAPRESLGIMEVVGGGILLLTASIKFSYLLYVFRLTRESAAVTEQGAAPNGGPVTLADNSGATEGPPSVS